MAVVVDLMLCVVLAVTAEQVLASAVRRRATHAALLALGTLALLPALPAATTADTTPAFFTGAASRIPTGANVLVTPWPDSNGSEAMLWQLRSGLRWSMPAGEAFGPEATLDGRESLLHTTVVDIDRRGAPVPALTPQLRAQLLSDLRALDVGAVVVGPSSGAERVESLFEQLLGRPADHAGGVAVWWDATPA
jgi:hypothetical protein